MWSFLKRLFWPERDVPVCLGDVSLVIEHLTKRRHFWLDNFFLAKSS